MFNIVLKKKKHPLSQAGVINRHNEKNWVL